MILRRNQTTSTFVALSIVIASLSFASPLMRHRAQERNRTVTPRPPTEPLQTAEPLMRIALSTDTRAATVLDYCEAPKRVGINRRAAAPRSIARAGGVAHAVADANR
jgi:hypothetical protein